MLIAAAAGDSRGPIQTWRIYSKILPHADAIELLGRARRVGVRAGDAGHVAVVGVHLIGLLEGAAGPAQDDVATGGSDAEPSQERSGVESVDLAGRERATENHRLIK